LTYVKILLATTLLLLLTSCSTVNQFANEPEIEPIAIDKLAQIKPPQRKVVVAVYEFYDLTGQRKSKGNLALFSTAVSQGSSNWLIKALKDAGGGTWFTVVERTFLDNLIQERQLIRNQRETYIGGEAQALRPLLYAGIILEGGIISYDSNLFTGGVGARYFGVGASTSWRKDQVTISLRAVSTQTGEVLLSVNTLKTILSVKAGIDTIKFLDMDTNALEIETGVAENEPVSYAVRAAIEQAVIGMIEEGINRNLWKYRE
jgi:curli production assembly/transport component CsgG